MMGITDRVFPDDSAHPTVGAVTDATTPAELDRTDPEGAIAAAAKRCPTGDAGAPTTSWAR